MVVETVAGEGPVVLGQPHGGTDLPGGFEQRLNQTGRRLADTDWHIATLYEGLLPGATIVRARMHRYVIDVNRDPSGQSLYPGQNTTALCPTTDFDGHPIYHAGEEPSEDEIQARTEAYHGPYHQALAAEIDRVRNRHGIAVLFDCHSIRSRIPFLFEGLLPVFNIGTNGGTSCSPPFQEAVVDQVRDLDHVVNGRFKGGWTTRHYGDPANGVEAIQLELAQRAYMDEAPPWTYREDKASAVRTCLAAMLSALEKLALEPGTKT